MKRGSTRSEIKDKIGTKSLYKMLQNGQMTDFAKKKIDYTMIVSKCLKVVK